MRGLLCIKLPTAVLKFYINEAYCFIIVAAVVNDTFEDGIWFNDAIFILQYLHALSNHIFVVDPLQGSNEVEDSRKAGYRFG